MFDINKISISIDGKKIVFQYIVDDENNNVINNSNELLFDKNYFLNNKKIISNIISGIILEKDISTVSVIDYNLVIPVIDIANNIKKITTLNIVEDKDLNNSICEKLLKSKYIKNVNCHQAPIYMLDNLDKKNIKVNFRVQYLSDSHFGMKNKLYSYSRMYYKNTLNFDKLLNEKDIQELQMFLSINNYLKKINIYNFSFDLVKQIINELCKNFKGNIQILIRANSENVDYIQESIPYLKTLNKIYKQKLNIRFKIEYSNEYKKKNTIKQFSNNVLLVSCLIIAIVSIFGLGIVQYNDYMTEKQSEEIKEITKVEINNDDVLTIP